ncbi:MAG TPA: DegT/DnrJ/EryC1/StrS family aminotransferase [Methanobacteriaceae archaeon]|nr:DegT/DnrJ/EryC1/StrS family aminotransferase [Methanobacteriaceae archaeon]
MDRKLYLKAKRPSKEATESMCRVAHDISNIEYDPRQEIRAAEDGVRKLTTHQEVRVVNSGNSAILAVMSGLKGPILIPDQGGWSGFNKMARFLGLEVQELTTDFGLIYPEVLNQYLKKNTCKSLFLTSFAGYTAEQPIKELYQICEENEVLLVEDASGSLGDPQKRLACGKHAHVILASTGSPKIVNVGSGGFFSTNNQDLIRDSKELTKILNPSPLTCAGLSVEIKNATLSFSKAVQGCEFLKKELETVFHQNKRGVNVCVPVNNPKKIAYQLRNMINVAGGGMITICPRYERINQKAVCLEIKNLDVHCLTQNNLELLVQIVKEVI